AHLDPHPVAPLRRLSPPARPVLGGPGRDRALRRDRGDRRSARRADHLQVGRVVARPPSQGAQDLGGRGARPGDGAVASRLLGRFPVSLRGPVRGAAAARTALAGGGRAPGAGGATRGRRRSGGMTLFDLAAMAARGLAAIQAAAPETTFAAGEAAARPDQVARGLRFLNAAYTAVWVILAAYLV